MKKIALSLIALVCAISCFAQNCTINGRINVPAFQNKKVSLIDGTNGKEIASTTIQDSTFSFSVTTTDPYLGRIKTASVPGSNYYYLDVIVEPGTITCDLVTDDLAGTPTNEKQYKFHKEIQNEIAYWYKLANKYYDKANMSEQEFKQLADETEAQTQKISDIAKQAFIENNDNLVALTAFEYIDQMNRIEYKELAQLVSKAAPAVQKHPIVANTMDQLERLDQTAAGKPYIDLDLKDFKTGKAVKLSKYINGKIALIDFWASWCKPCREEIPNIAKMYEKYGKDIVVISLNVWDQPQAQSKAIKDMKMNWLQLTDNTKNATTVYGINGIPHIMLIGKDGTILARDLRGDDIEKAVLEALK